MKISTKGRYALRVMLDLAVNNTGEYISLKDISRRQDITVKYLEQVMNLLRKAGFVTALRGNNGGYMLNRSPDEYTVGEILRACEGSLAPVACLEGGGEVVCEKADTCTTLQFWKGLDRVISEYVDKYTLQDLLDEHDKLAGDIYSI